MTEAALSISPRYQMIEVTVKDTEQELEKVVDADLAAFDTWFQTYTKSEALVRSERAILKAYLWFKIKGTINAP